MENSPAPKRLEKRELTRWLRISHVLCLLLGVFVVFALRLHGNASAQRVRKANVALAGAYLPQLPSSARELSFLHEGLLFGERYIISFEADTDAIHTWIKAFSKSPGLDNALGEKTGIIKYELTKFTVGNRSHGDVIIDEKSQRVYAYLEFINCSL